MSRIASLQRRVGLLTSFIGFIVFFTNLVNICINTKPSFIDVITNPSISIVFISTLVILSTAIFTNKVFRLVQVALAFLNGAIGILDVYDGFYSIGFVVIAIILSYKYGFLRKYLYLKLAIISGSTLALIEISARLAKPNSLVTGIDAVMFLIFFFAIVWFSFEEEIKLYRKRNVALLQENAEAKIQNMELQGVVKEHTKELIRKNSALEKALKEKGALLHEVHHRVKNNLATMDGLLALQLSGIEDERIVSIIQQSKNRIKAMALVHEEAYLSNSFAKVNLSDLISKLIGQLEDIYNPQRKNKVEINCKNVVIHLEEAVYCGLIISEALTNALIHAFPQEEYGKVELSAHQNADGKVNIEIKDNGRGFDQTQLYSHSQKLGLWLIHNLAQGQLEGSAKLSTDKGTHWKISFSSSYNQKKSAISA